MGGSELACEVAKGVLAVATVDRRQGGAVAAVLGFPRAARTAPLPSPARPEGAHAGYEGELEVRLDSDDQHVDVGASSSRANQPSR